MENKKIKLTISGKPKKLQKKFEISSSHKGKSVLSGKPQNKFVKKETSFRPNKPTSPIKKQGVIGDFEKRKLAEQRATRRLKDEGSLKDKKVKLNCEAKNLSQIKNEISQYDESFEMFLSIHHFRDPPMCDSTAVVSGI